MKRKGRTGGTNLKGRRVDVGRDAIGRDSVGIDVTINEATPSTPHMLGGESGEHGQKERTDDSCPTSVDWGLRDQKLLQRYFSMCATHDDDFKEHIEPDEPRLREYFCENGLADQSPNGMICLTQAGVLLCCKKKRFPYKDLHVHVKFQNKADPAELTEEFFGPVMFLYEELNKRLRGLSERKMGSPNIRDASGAEAVFHEYPPTAITEALVNSLIHRDYHLDDIGFVTIYSDRVEFINPGKSLVPVAVLREAKEDLRPQYYRRNPRLIEAMSRARLNQRAGSGMKRIREELSRNGSYKSDGSLGLEINNDEEGNRFAITIFRRRTFDPSPAALHQFPLPPSDFTGREDELKELRTAIASGGATISGLTGQGGVGKTALALKLADEIKAQFPDAQIYLNLLGVSEKPLTTGEAMAYVIRAFEPEAKLPEQEPALGAIYRSVLDGKRALLLMDNAKDAAQVRPLIPPKGCFFLVTSRLHFALPGLRAKDLETLPPGEAEELLLKIAPRIGGEASAIARLCGYLPQALRLAATALAERVNMAPSDYRQRLADEKNRPKLLAAGNESVEASISLSYGLLDAEAQKRWRMLGVFPETFDGAAAAVWSAEKNSTEDTLGLLTQYSMLEWNEKARRYRLHDLMRDFARQKLAAEERHGASLRHARHYLEVLRSANDLYMKGGDSLMSGLALFDLERGNIEAGQAWAKEHAVDDSTVAGMCSDYPDAGVYCLGLRQHPREWIGWLEAGLAAARRLGDRAGEGMHLGNLGNAYQSLGEYRRGIECHERALLIDREIGDKRGEGQDLGGLGNAYQSLGEYRRAMEHYEQRLQIAREIGDRRGEGDALGNLGNAYYSLGEYHRTIEYHEQQLQIAREIGDRRGEGGALGNLGNAYYSLGEYRRAIEYCERQLQIALEIGDRRGEGGALSNLGNAHGGLGEHRRAIDYYEQGLQIAREIGDRYGGGCTLWNMSLALNKLGDRKEAIKLAEASLKIREEIEDPFAPKVRKQLEEWRKA